MMKPTVILCFFVFVFFAAAEGAGLYDPWPQGPSSDPNYFPLGVWLQSPADAALYHQAGINFYDGLWEGPTVSQLETLKNARMQTVCDLNDTALQYKDVTLSDGRPLIMGYSHYGEPDNMQDNPEGGLDLPIPTSVVQSSYFNIKNLDPNRPVFLNLSQGIGNDGGTWVGQGGYIVPDRDYPEYILGSDVISFDIYPMDCERTNTCQDAWRVALGVDRLFGYAPQGHIVWNTIETSDICGNDRQATVEEIRAEVWMSIIHGAKGLTYFIHGKTSIDDFDYRAILRPENADRLAGFTQINHQVQSLAPVIHSPDQNHLAVMQSLEGDSPVDFAVKIYEGATYIFSVSMRQPQTIKQFQVKSIPDSSVEVLGEDRTLSLVNGTFSDTFTGYEAHLYKIDAVPVLGDLDLDRRVNFSDFDRFAGSWLALEGQEGWQWNADLFPDEANRIDLCDLVVLAEHWGRRE